MAVNTKIEKNPDGGFSIVIEEDGSGDLNRIMGELCQKHREAKDKGEELNPQTPKEICQEILQAISEASKLPSRNTEKIALKSSAAVVCFEKDCKVYNVLKLLYFPKESMRSFIEIIINKWFL